MSIKLQIVAKQTEQDEFKDGSLSSFSVVNNPVSKFWTIPGGSFVPSNNGVLIVIADAYSEEDSRQMIEDLIVQAIKYSVHDAEVDWGKADASEILREAMSFAHQQLISFKSQNEGIDNVLAQASIVLFRNEKVHICWTGNGNIYRYSDTTREVMKITDIQKPGTGSEQPLSISIDNSLDGQLSDLMGSASFQPMVKYIDANIYQGDFIFGLSKGLMNLNYNTIEQIIRTNSNSSNMIINELFNAYESIGKGNESAVICKVVQGKQFMVSPRAAMPVAQENLVEISEENIPGKNKPRPVWILNSALIVIVIFIVGLQIRKWNADDEAIADNTTTVIEEEVSNENLILLMAENFDIDSTSTADIPEEQKEEISTATTIESNQIASAAEKAPTPVISTDKETKTKEKVAVEKTKKLHYSAEIKSLVNELEVLKSRIPLLMDYNEEYIKSMKSSALNKVQQGLTAAKYYSGKPGQKEVIENVISEANTEFRNLQIAISNRSERE